MKLFWSIGSQPGRTVKTIIDIGKENKRDQARTPILVVFKDLPKRNYTLLGESNAILIYLCQKYPSLLTYYGIDIVQRAKVNQQLSWYQNNFRVNMFKPFRRYLAFAYSGVKFYQGEKDQLWKLMIQSIEDFQKYMSYQNKFYVAGNRVTIADFLYFYQLTNLKYFKMGIDSYPWITKWNERMQSIKEVEQIMKEWNSVALERAELFSTLQLPKR